MTISIPFGKTQLELRLPDGLDVSVLHPHSAAPAPNPTQAVRDALENVDWAHYGGARSAAIAINDKTRPVPHDILLPPLLERLEKHGIPRDKITLIIATGSHKPMTPDEYPGILPAEIIANYRVISHDIGREQDIIRLGMTTRQTIVSTNRAYLEANLRLAVGNVEPHQFAGFSGGAKTAAIGLAGWDTINGNHRMMTDPKAGLGRYDDNPVRQDIEDMGRVVGVHLALNTLLNDQKQIVKVFFGAPLNVMQAAIPAVRQVYELPVNAPFDLVVASPGGYPKDINIYQSQKALGHASLVTRQNGAIIMAAACVEGSGSSIYENWLRTHNHFKGAADPQQAAIDRFRAEGYSVGPHKAYQIARDTVGRRVIWVSELPDPAQFLLESAASLDEAVARAIKANPAIRRVGVMPYANATIPTLQPAEV